jgi:hypothetical protein
MKKRLKRISLFLGVAVLGGVFAVSLASGLVLRGSPLETRAGANDPYYLVGTINGWSLENHDYQLVKVGESTLYRWTGNLATNVEFKLNADTEAPFEVWDYVKGYGELSSVLKGTVLSDAGGNIKVTYSSGTPTFEVLYDTSNSEFRVQYLSTFAEPLTGGINSNRMRVFLNRGNTYAKDGAINCLQFASSIEWNTTIHKPAGYVNTGLKYTPVGETEQDLYFAYFDLNIADLANGYKLRVVRTSGGDNAYVHIWDTTSEITWTIGDNNLLLYVGDNWSHALSSGIIADDVLLPLGYGEGEAWQSYGFIEKVLEGYLSCSNSAVNGYNAFPQMELTFFKKADKTTWKIDGDLSAISVWDYTGTGTSGYGSDKGTGTTVTGWQKFSRLSYEYAANNPSEATHIFDNVGYSSENRVLLIVLVSIIGLTSIAGLYILKKKRA